MDYGFFFFYRYCCHISHLYMNDHIYSCQICGDFSISNFITVNYILLSLPYSFYIICKKSYNAVRTLMYSFAKHIVQIKTIFFFFFLNTITLFYISIISLLAIYKEKRFVSSSSNCISGISLSNLHFP